jgi:hypothetical protein
MAALNLDFIKTEKALGGVFREGLENCFSPDRCVTMLPMYSGQVVDIALL